MEIFGYKIYKKKEIDKTFFNRYKALQYLFKNNKDLTIFDVGGNIGQSVEEFLINWPDSSIYSFEPDQKVFDILKKYESNNVKCFNQGFGDKTENKLLNIYKETGNNSFLDINEECEIYKNGQHPKFTNGAKKCTTQSCSVDTLDNFTTSNNINNINLLKIDVQGFENNVLLGAKDLLKSNLIDVIVVEVILDDMYGKNNSFFELESIFKDYGYTLWDISHIYKDLERGKTIWIDAIYVSESKKSAL